MENYDINTVGRGPAVPGIEWTLEGWKYLSSAIKESFSSIDKAYNPAQEMVTKEHEAGLRMMENTDCSEEMRKVASQHVRESREAAQTLASNRMTDVLKVIGAFATLTAAALGGTQYIRYTNR